MQKDLICARLMGRKQILNISTVLDESPDSDGQYQFRIGIGRFSFKIDDADYPKLIDVHRKLEKLKLCPKKNISFNIQGMVVNADAEYSGNDLKSFVLKLENIKLSKITTIYAKGGFVAQRKPLDKKIDEEYQRYFNAGIKKKKKPKTPKKLKTFTNSIGMEFVRVPAGSFGSLFECGGSGTAGKFNNGFYIGRYEVTQGQWKAVMGNNPSHFKNCGDNCPVENVSWNDAQKFIAKINQKGEGTYRLPSEAEWEYAARAGSVTDYCFGDDESELSQYAWYHKNAGNSTHPVGQLKPNEWGLYDMHGNVWEWCQDWYDDGAGRVLRGGGWSSGGRSVRSANRYRYVPDYRNDFSGLRFVRGQK
ncbi:formylglycine-generating enzyme family protein [Desulfococcaceae bacterium HSG7]|nr:formylglycine-generating enzyme family protein [Desulfococcaceae bacterium HSG7]